MTHFDLPSQAILQQSAARPLSGEELETLGKHASAQHRCGKGTLNEAVVDVVKSAGLSPEQVRRVCEFANTDAFISDFRKEGSATKYVHFEGGPADFSEVLKDLNDGGGGTVFDRGQADYSHAPLVMKMGAARTVQQNRSAMEKTAGVKLSPPPNPADDVLAEAFGFEKKAEPIPFHRPMQDVEGLRDKLASARDAATADMSELETVLLNITDDLYFQVKQAAMDGVPLGHVVQAWEQALEPPSELVKAAFAIIGPRLVRDEVVGWESMGKSLEKTASSRAVVRDDHPIIQTFGAYCEGVTKLAELRVGRDELIAGHTKLDTFQRSVEQNYPEHV